MDETDVAVATARPSTAERLDRALDRALEGRSVVGDGDLQPLLSAAAEVLRSLVPMPASAGFSERLEARLAGGSGHRLVAAIGALAMRRPPASWLLLTGAASSAAVGLTAILVWRGTRRAHAHGLRLGGR
jgi:hypothetical protein